MNKGDSAKRFWELDFWRGLSIIAMIGFHQVWNLSYFGFIQLNMISRKSLLVANTIGASFLLIVGISLYISYQRGQKHLAGAELTKKFLIRGAMILGWALVISLASTVVIGEPIIFGILHLVGTAIILTIPLFNQRRLAGFLGLAIILYSITMPRMDIFSDWLLITGVTKVHRYMADYYPLVPWLGFVYVGLFLGEVFYPEGKRRFSIGNRPKCCAWISFLGRHALFIYLAHQPVLFLLTYGLKILCR